MAVSEVHDYASMILKHTPQSYTFHFSPFLRQVHHHGLPADRPICKAYASGHCPNGTKCLDRHVSDPAATKTGGGAHASGLNSLVCKHWLRGLCKKGEQCEFLHEYNLRKMPECNFFARNGYCSNGEECLYLHIDPQSRMPPCPHYDRGFCPLGPMCAKKHVRRTLCPFYLAGFCPDGKECKEGVHPKWSTNLEKPTAKVEKTEDEDAVLSRRMDMPGGDDDRDRFRDRDRDEPRFHRGRGGKWRGRGERRFRGRGY